MPYPYITKILTTYDNKSRSPQTDLRHHTIEFSRFARAQLSLFYFGFASINNEIIYSRPFGPRINNYWCLKSVCGDLDLLSVGRNNYYYSINLDRMTFIIIFIFMSVQNHDLTRYNNSLTNVASFHDKYICTNGST